jgi:hypothetical protein
LGGPAISWLAYVISVIALLGSPTLVFVTHLVVSLQNAISATCLALFSRTSYICCAIPRVGVLHAYCICPIRGGRLSEVHCPATMTNSLSVQ